MTLHQLIIGNQTAQELIQVIEVAQGEGYGHSEAIDEILAQLRLWVQP